jgi:hypothetical protein
VLNLLLERKFFVLDPPLLEEVLSAGIVENLVIQLVFMVKMLIYHTNLLTGNLLIEDNQLDQLVVKTNTRRNRNLQRIRKVKRKLRNPRRRKVLRFKPFEWQKDLDLR